MGGAGVLGWRVAMISSDETSDVFCHSENVAKLFGVIFFCYCVFSNFIMLREMEGARPNQSILSHLFNSFPFSTGWFWSCQFSATYDSAQQFSVRIYVYSTNFFFFLSVCLISFISFYSWHKLHEDVYHSGETSNDRFNLFHSSNICTYRIRIYLYIICIMFVCSVSVYSKK